MWAGRARFQGGNRAWLKGKVDSRGGERNRTSSTFLRKRKHIADCAPEARKKKKRLADIHEGKEKKNRSATIQGEEGKRGRSHRHLLLEEKEKLLILSGRVRRKRRNGVQKGGVE